MLKTAESVSPKHPDKICDQISDAILDAYLKKDENSRVAVDVAGGHGKVFITGEVSSKAEKIDVSSIVERLAGDVEIVENISKQSPEIAQGVDIGGAGDQGIMIGYATDETNNYIPLEVALSRSLNEYLYKIWPYDGKTQVSFNGSSIDSIVASFQNAPKTDLELAVKDWARNLRKFVEPKDSTSLYPCFRKWINSNPDLYINPAGDWNIGGFDADAGLTGRKLAIDNYGPFIPVGGGAFSGKDATKVDRSAAYMARKIAIDYLKRFQAKKVFVYLAYSIGEKDALQSTVFVDGEEKVLEGYDLTPNGIIEYLDLKKPIFEETARYGHFGHKKFSWDN